jgi:hypothetical protein
MKKQVFLGGACGNTTWRRDIAIPALETAGITYFNPQLGVGEWTTGYEAIEMEAKHSADVFLFVIDGNTRGVASVAEVAYLLAERRPLALVVTDIAEGSQIGDRTINQTESDDLNRGRIFIRTMAACHDVPVFQDVKSAVHHAIALAGSSKTGLTLSDVRQVLSDISYLEHEFLVETADGGFNLQLRCREEDFHAGEPSIQYGRKWHICQYSSTSEIVQTAFKAVLTWVEHDAREHFRYKGAQVFGPHFDVERLVDLCRSSEVPQESQ